RPKAGARTGSPAATGPNGLIRCRGAGRGDPVRSETGDRQPGLEHRLVPDRAELARALARATPQAQQERLGRPAQRGVALLVDPLDVVPLVVRPDEPLALDIGAVHVQAPGRVLEVLAGDLAADAELEVLVDPVARQV